MTDCLHTIVGTVKVDPKRDRAAFVGECPAGDCDLEVEVTVSPARNAQDVIRTLTAAHQAQANAPALARKLTPALLDLLRACGRGEVFTGPYNAHRAVYCNGRRVDPSRIRILLAHDLIHTVPEGVGDVHSWRPTPTGHAVLHYLEGS